MVAAYRQQLDWLLADYRHACLQVKEEKAAVREAKQNLKAAQQAQALVQQIAEKVQALAHQQITGVVTKSLEAVFDDPYTFHIKFERKRGRTEGKLIFQRDGYELEDPKNEAGVGQIDVAALALRLSCLMLERPIKRRLIVIDEPMKNVNGTENRKRAAALLASLSKELNVQLLMATGYEWLRLGKIIQIGEE